MKKAEQKDGQKSKGKRFKEKPNKKKEDKVKNEKTEEKQEEIEQENEKQEETQEDKKIEEENELSENTQEDKTLEEENSEEKQDKKENVHSNRKIKKIIYSTIIVIILIAIGIFSYLIFRPKFKNVKIELGTSEINIDMFLVSQMYKNKAEFVTDISQIDLNTDGEKEIVIS